MLIQRCTSYKVLKKGLQVLEYQEQVLVSAPAGLLRSRATYDNCSYQGINDEVTKDIEQVTRVTNTYSGYNISTFPTHTQY